MLCQPVHHFRPEVFHRLTARDKTNVTPWHNDKLFLSAANFVERGLSLRKLHQVVCVAGNVQDRELDVRQAHLLTGDHELIVDELVTVIEILDPLAKGLPRKGYTFLNPAVHRSPRLDKLLIFGVFPKVLIGADEAEIGFEKLGAHGIDQFINILVAWVEPAAKEIYMGEVDRRR